jgi:hypothetical protein
LQLRVPPPAGNPRWVNLCSGFGAARNTGTGISEDYAIPQLPAILALRDLEISRMVWNTVCNAGPHTMWARWSPNQTWEPNRVLSQLAVVLRDTDWIPASDGSFRRPNAITAAELANGFPIQPALAWLETIGFGSDHRQRSEQHQARRNAAESMGLPAELADQLGAMSEQSRAALAAEMIRRIADGEFTTPAFPERVSGSPERRASRVAEHAQGAPAKVYELRERSVRTSGGDARESARIYLRDMYTNDAKQMVCQGCHDQMPFRLAGGEYYFEAVTLLPSVTVELSENHLALCPTCTAKAIRSVHAR